MLVLAAGLAACVHTEIERMPTPIVCKSTPVLFAERIEPCLAFWERLGLRRENEAAAGDHLAFAALAGEAVEIMYQTVEAVADEPPQTRKAAADGRTFLFVEVSSLASVRKALTGVPVYVEERKTFYGSTEMAYLDPAGNIITFAQFGER